MRPDPKAAFALGLVALFLFVGAGVAFALDPALFSRRIPWIAHFESIATLDEGAPVYAHGVIVGRVGSLEWVPATRDYRVVLRMNPEWRPPPDGAMRVQEPNPLRSPVVAMVEGVACIGHRPPPDTDGPSGLATCRRAPGIIEVADQVLAQIAGVTAQVATLVGTSAPGTAERTRIEEVADNVTALTGSVRALVDGLTALEPDLRKTVTSAHDLAADADAMVRKTDVTVDAVRRETLMRVNRTLDSAEQIVRADAAPLQSALADLRYVLGASSSSVVRLVAQLDAITANLAELTRQLRENPAVLLRGRSLDNPPGTGAAGK